jgi:hypothetical protein
VSAGLTACTFDATLEAVDAVAGRRGQVLAAVWPRGCRQMRPVRLKSGKPSYRLVAWRCGVLAEVNRYRLQVRVMQEHAHERGGSAKAAPVVIPQR